VATGKDRGSSVFPLAALTCVLLLASGGACSDDGAPGPGVDARADTGADVGADSHGFRCGFCSGDNCCCSGLDSECKSGYLCWRDAICEPVNVFSFDTTVYGKIKDPPPATVGTSWDADGLPDPYVVIRRGTQELYRSTADQDTLDISAFTTLSGLSPGQAILIEVFDEDGASDTLVYRGGWPGGIPHDVFLNPLSIQLPTTVDHTTGMHLQLQKK